MTNPTELLPRFASASQWLAENHPDAPRLPDHIEIYICSITGPIYLLSGMTGYINDQSKLFIASSGVLQCERAVLDSFVVWAMEVAIWSPCQTETRPPNPDAIENRAYDTVWCVEYLDESMIRTTDHFTEAALWCLESICTALGREG